MIGTTITVDVALLLLVSSNVATWIKVIVDAKRSRANGKERAMTQACGADPKLVNEHIGLLAEHTSEIGALGRSLDLVRLENTAAHDKMDKKQDRMIEGGRGEN